MSELLEKTAYDVLTSAGEAASADLQKKAGIGDLVKRLQGLDVKGYLSRGAAAAKKGLGDAKTYLGTSEDARNALVGSALGGLVLGGAGLLSDRDPEESKWAPVGDALLGAVLGGAAGYGVPRGLHLFAHNNDAKPGSIPDSPVVKSVKDALRPVIGPTYRKIRDWNAAKFSPDSSFPLLTNGWLTEALGAGTLAANVGDYLKERLKAARYLKAHAGATFDVARRGILDELALARTDLHNVARGIGDGNRRILDRLNAARSQVSRKMPDLSAKIREIDERIVDARRKFDTEAVKTLKFWRRGLVKAQRVINGEQIAAQKDYDANVAGPRRRVKTLYARSRVFDKGTYDETMSDAKHVLDTSRSKADRSDAKAIIKAMKKELAKAKAGGSDNSASVTARVGEAARSSATVPRGRLNPLRWLIGNRRQYAPNPEAILPGRGVKGMALKNMGKRTLLATLIGGGLDALFGEMARRNAANAAGASAAGK